MRNRILQGYDSHGSGLFRHFPDTIWLPCFKSSVRSTVLLTFSVILIVVMFSSTRYLDTTDSFGNLQSKPTETTNYPEKISEISKKPQKIVEIPPNFTAYNLTGRCPSDYPTSFKPEDDPDRSSPPMCPEYFRWIHEDLRPWARSGITKDMIERAKPTANFKLVILNGKAYLESYQKSFQTRDVFTVWGILQLLRRYPGKVPDLELMFDCGDFPVIRSEHYTGHNASTPPLLFGYCQTDKTLNIIFPDWSFWGWSEVNVKPWEIILEELKEGNNRTSWMKREPYAYWKGNPFVAEHRQQLMKCNVSEKQDWNARLYAQDWIKESRKGFKESNLASQCTHRYKIYVEGAAWSVSEKYILACDSVTLLFKPHYLDFFTRGLIPVHHYWPINADDKCRSIKFAVDWGNNHKKKAQAIGKAGSNFIQEELKMDYVYDYMFHLLNSFAKLFRYKPTKSEAAVELCVESMLSKAEGIQRKFMMESMVKSPANTYPCTMPPPYDPPSLFANLRRKEAILQQVQLWEKRARKP